MRIKKTIAKTISIFIILSIVSVPLHVFAENTFFKAVNYNISVSLSSGGEAYWNFSKNMNFFASTGTNSYNQNCRIKSGNNYNFSYLIGKSIIVKPNKGYCFDGFYNKNGDRIFFDAVKMNVIRIKKNGKYYYDYIQSLHNSKFNNYTKKAYDAYIKAYVKTLYNVSGYKIMFETTMYHMPKKDWNIYIKFKPKEMHPLVYQGTYTKIYGDSMFQIAVINNNSADMVFKSSNPRVLSVDKENGLAEIKGEGKVTVTVTAEETEKYLETKRLITVNINPCKITLISVVKKSTGKIHLKWSRDSKCTGYKVELSNFINFSKGVYLKTIRSSKTLSTYLKSTDGSNYKYARIRSYKISLGTTLYGEWSNVKHIT